MNYSVIWNGVQSVEGKRPPGRFANAHAQLGASIVMIHGGCSWKKGSKFTFLDDFWLMRVLSPNEVQWEPLSQRGQLPGPRAYHHLCVIGRKLYLFGGKSAHDDKVVTPGIHVFDYMSRSWYRLHLEQEEEPASLGCSASVIDHQVFIFGGMTRGRVSSKTRIFQPSTSSWINLETSGAIPPARCDHAATVVNAALYIHGGCAASDVYLSDLYQLDTNTLAWTRIDQGGPLNIPRAGHSLTPHHTKDLYVFGGFNDLIYPDGGPITEELCKYSIGQSRWKVPKALPTECIPDITYHHSAYIIHSHLYIVGGLGLNGMSNDVQVVRLLSPSERDGWSLPVDNGVYNNVYDHPVSSTGDSRARRRSSTRSSRRGSKAKESQQKAILSLSTIPKIPASDSKRGSQKPSGGSATSETATPRGMELRDRVEQPLSSTSLAVVAPPHQIHESEPLKPSGEKSSQNLEKNGNSLQKTEAEVEIESKVDRQQFATSMAATENQIEIERESVDVAVHHPLNASNETEDMKRFDQSLSDDSKKATPKKRLLASSFQVMKDDDDDIFTSGSFPTRVSQTEVEVNDGQHASRSLSPELVETIEHDGNSSVEDFEDKPEYEGQPFTRPCYFPISKPGQKELGDKSYTVAGMMPSAKASLSDEEIGSVETKPVEERSKNVALLRKQESTSSAESTEHDGNSSVEEDKLKYDSEIKPSPPAFARPPVFPISKPEQEELGDKSYTVAGMPSVKASLSDEEIGSAGTKPVEQRNENVASLQKQESTSSVLSIEHDTESQEIKELQELQNEAEPNLSSWRGLVGSSSDSDTTSSTHSVVIKKERESDSSSAVADDEHKKQDNAEFALQPPISSDVQQPSLNTEASSEQMFGESPRHMLIPKADSPNLNDSLHERMTDSQEVEMPLISDSREVEMPLVSDSREIEMPLVSDSREIEMPVEDSVAQYDRNDVSRVVENENIKISDDDNENNNTDSDNEDDDEDDDDDDDDDDDESDLDSSVTSGSYKQKTIPNKRGIDTVDDDEFNFDIKDRNTSSEIVEATQEIGHVEGIGEATPPSAIPDEIPREETVEQTNKVKEDEVKEKAEDEYEEIETPAAIDNGNSDGTASSSEDELNATERQQLELLSGDLTKVPS